MPLNRVSRKYDYQLKLNIPKNGARVVQSNSFCYGTVKAWNDLPKNVAHAKIIMINIFKTKLEKTWKDLL